MQSRRFCLHWHIQKLEEKVKFHPSDFYYCLESPGYPIFAHYSLVMSLTQSMACHGNFSLSGKHCVTQSAGELRAPLPGLCSCPYAVRPAFGYIHIALLRLVADGEKEIFFITCSHHKQGRGSHFSQWKYVVSWPKSSELKCTKVLKAGSRPPITYCLLCPSLWSQQVPPWLTDLSCPCSQGEELGPFMT